MSQPTTTPAPPYYAVIFTSQRSTVDAGYARMAEEVLALARIHPGFLGFESARQEIGISVSYWQSLAAIRAWQDNALHRQAQARAGEWYAYFHVRVCRVERAYGFGEAADLRAN
jgi:heme-degrading monooxygenase HmoA